MLLAACLVPAPMLVRLFAEHRDWLISACLGAAVIGVFLEPITVPT
jgi:hypothetical protein